MVGIHSAIIIGEVAVPVAFMSHSCCTASVFLKLFIPEPRMTLPSSQLTSQLTSLLTSLHQSLINVSAHVST